MIKYTYKGSYPYYTQCVILLNNEGKVARIYTEETDEQTKIMIERLYWNDEDIKNNNNR